MKIGLSILDMVVDTFKDTAINSEFTRSEIVNLVVSKYGCNPTSVIPSDYCYNRLNNGINYEKYLHLFEYTDTKKYRFLGLNYPYTGKIIHKPRGGYEIVVGELKDGTLISYDKCAVVAHSEEIEAQKKQTNMFTGQNAISQ